MIGTMVNKYKVLRLLGQGGMGEVYEAVDESLERKVAIKILLPEYAKDAEIVGRFFNEARSVNMINHPGLVQIFEFGSLPEGGAFLVMEYIAGISLRDHMKRGDPLSEMEVLQICLQLASALAATHEKGIVHRDLKPGNVMLVRDPTMPTGQRVKLLDFGIAKLGAKNSRDDQPQTRTGLSIGTPAYMSPEQCRDTKTVIGQADVYSLGVMMYQLLCGRLPFDGSSEGALMGAHMYEEPKPLLSLAPHISRPVASLVHRMLAKQPEKRPMAKKLEEILIEMAAAVVPATARPSTKLKTVSLASSTETAPVDPDGEHQSTLSRSAAEASSGRRSALAHFVLRITDRSPWLTQHTSPRQRLAGLGAGALILFGTVAFLLVGSLRKPSTVVVAQPAAKVHWQLDSNPSGAKIIRKSDQVVLGQTPWTYEQSAASGKLDLLLRLDGFKERAIAIDQSQDVKRSETMEALPPSTPEPAGSTKKRGKKTISADNPADPSQPASSHKRVKLID